MPEPPALPPQPVLLYDGECGLCESSVSFILRNEKNPRLNFAPQQGEAGQALMRQHRCELPDPGSLVLLHGDRTYFYSDAVLRSTVLMGGVWAGLGRAGLLVPRFVRDPVYRFIARHRYQWFGSASGCLLMTPELKKRFFM